MHSPHNNHLHYANIVFYVIHIFPQLHTNIDLNVFKKYQIIRIISDTCVPWIVYTEYHHASVINLNKVSIYELTLKLYMEHVIDQR